MSCLFCITGSDFNTVEHIIPESLGNDDLILTGEVCDKCQNFFSHIENYVLRNTPIGFWRTLLGIKTKAGKLAKLWWARDTHSEMQFKDVKNLMRSAFDKIYAEKWLDKLGIEKSFYDGLNEVEN